MVCNCGLIVLSLTIYDVKHLFLCLLAVCISSLEKDLFVFFVHFESGFFVVVELLEFSIFWINLYQLYDLQIFSVGCLCALLIVSLHRNFKLS